MKKRYNLFLDLTPNVLYLAESYPRKHYKHVAFLPVFAFRGGLACALTHTTLAPREVPQHIATPHTARLTGAWCGVTEIMSLRDRFCFTPYLATS